MGQIITIKGNVQGLGFRPFLYRLCKEFGLKGFIQNTSSGVRLGVNIEDKSLGSFMEKLHKDKPYLSYIENIQIDNDISLSFEGLEVISSEQQKDKRALVLPDIATCKDCLGELFDPRNRRYLYPFINCTNCGPRFTIIKDIPYDRANTTMAGFKMCQECKKEYKDVSNRRFHAQPNACYDCGPEIFLYSVDGKVLVKGRDSIKEAADFIRKGYVCALKSLGGFQLVVLAHDKAALEKLRDRKKRINKPFALMAKDTDMVRRYCFVSKQEEDLLSSYKSPVVILRKIKGCDLPESVAPRQKYLGFMLPYTPLHHILFSYIKQPLVMTSGNITEEPLCFKNDEAREKLKGVADVFLSHNRDINIRCDDSVSRVVSLSGNRKRELVIRRARGYTPQPVYTESPFKKKVLSLGANLKNTVCLAKENHLFLSHYIGTLDYLACRDSFMDTVNHFIDIYDIRPEVIACDMHPDYYSSKAAKRLSLQKSLPLIEVQHHHAHIVSCMVEHNLKDKVIGVSFDGTGYGLDNTVWGGEILLADRKDFNRVGHLDLSLIPGSDSAVKNPWKMGLSLLQKVFGQEAYRVIQETSLFRQIEENKISFVLESLNRKINCFSNSSMGRLFSGVSSILGLTYESTFDAEAEIRLEQEIDEGCSESYQFDCVQDNGCFVIKYDEVIRAITADLKKDINKSVISAKFHNGLADVTVAVLSKLRDIYGISKVCLSGGVFQNIYLLKAIHSRLDKRSFRVFLNENIPINDSGISCGQAAVAAARLDASN